MSILLGEFLGFERARVGVQMQMLNALIVGDDILLRNRLKQASDFISCMKKVDYCGAYDRALSVLTTSAAYDLVFIAFCHRDEETLAFIQDAKKTTGGEDSAFIRVMCMEKSSESTLAESFMKGFDGFLFEPFSVDNMQQMAQIALSVKKRKVEERAKVAIELLVKKVIIEFSRYAFCKSIGSDTERIKKELIRLRNELKPHAGQHPELHRKIITELFEQIPPPLQSKYTGVSKRVRARLNTNLRHKCLLAA